MYKSIVLIAFLVSLSANAQSDSTLQHTQNEKLSRVSVTNYMGTGDTIVFNASKFILAWSSNPVQGYYKHEYLLDSTTVDNYNEMFIVEALKGQISPTTAAQVKVDELKKLKKKNPIINWTLYENQGDVIIDFILSDQETLYEWDLYRYTERKNANGQKYLVLYAYSFKDALYTNEDLKLFFNRILENRESLITKLGEVELPELKIQE